MEENDRQKNEQSSADLLHKDRPLQSLRTYQGDVAEAIKSQNESVATIAIKEKVKKEEDKPVKLPEPSNLPFSMVSVFLGIILLAGSAFALLFVFRAIQSNPDVKPISTEEIIPANNQITISGATRDNLKSELQKITGTGIVTTHIETLEGKRLENAEDFLKLTQAELPNGFARNLGIFSLGVYFSESSRSTFLLLKTQEFGLAFSGLLEWEKRMETDLPFFERRSSGATYVWKDLIIKNKDVRALTNTENQDDFVMGYTFMDKNTILITDTAKALADISSLYASRAVAR